MKEIYRLALYALKTIAAQTVATIQGNLVGYGVTAPQSAALEAAYENYSSALEDAAAAKTAYKTAIEAQYAAKAELTAQMASIWHEISNNPSVTDTMIVAAGYSPKDTVRTPVVPVMVTDLLATPHATNSATLTWNRNGNARSVNFLIETQVPGTDSWTYAYQTTRTKITLVGIPVGVPANFRVTAQHGNEKSQPSLHTSIYMPVPMASAFLEAA